MTGLVIGEALALRGPDVDLGAGTLTVWGTVVWVNGRGLMTGGDKDRRRCPHACSSGVVRRDVACP